MADKILKTCVQPFICKYFICFYRNQNESLKKTYNVDGMLCRSYVILKSPEYIFKFLYSLANEIQNEFQRSSAGDLKGP